MAFSEEFLNELKRRNDIRTVVSRYISIKGTGKNPKGLCPFHGEKTPSFTLYTDSDSFYCFGCGVGGDVIRFTMLIENLDYAEAVKLLAERSGIEVPPDGIDDGFLKLKNTVLSINRETARFFNSYMMSTAGKKGYSYFKDRRLADATIRHFGLGYAPDSWTALADHLRNKGFHENDMITANVVYRGKNGRVYDRFRNRAMFPVIDLRGNVIAFSGRKMPDSDDTSKYVNTSDTPVYKKSHNLFALNFAKEHCKENLILCEGQMDVIALHQAGFCNAVAPLGTSFTSEQAQLISRYTPEVIITMDADSAGQKATEKAMGILSRAGVSVRVVRIPDGKDPDEFMKTYGKEGPHRFKALLEGAKGDVQYRLLRAADGIDTNSDDGKVRFLGRAAEILASIPSPIERDVYAGRLSEKYSVDKRVITAQVDRLFKKQRQTNAKKEARAAITVPYRDEINPQRGANMRAANAEEAIIALLIKNPNYLLRDERLKPELFITDFNRRLFGLISDRIQKGFGCDITHLSGELSGEETGRLAAILAREDARSSSFNEFEMCLCVLIEENEKKEIEADLSDDGDIGEIIKRIAKTKIKGS